ncbi:MAG: C4-type zinc ribbon domain-containing protein [Akkermansiaceae bacterium]|nr:C4-type zinc ribbon domain-containing protein [Akkermansiaceae bacterium]
MQDEVRALLILQDRDRRLLALAKDLLKLPQDETRAKAKLAGDEAAVAKAHQALLDCELRVKKIELDAETRRTTIKRLKLQQFETRKNEEFVALGHEIMRYEKDLDEFETQELVAMEEVDGFRAKLKAAEAALVHTRTLVEEDLASIAQRHAKMEADRAEVSVEREKLALDVPESLIPLYLRLMKIKDGVAVAPMRQGKCGGCHMKLIASTVMKVTSGREIAQCEDCGRILYADD